MKSNLSYEKVSFVEAWPELEPLATEQWQEVPNFGKDGTELVFNYDTVAAIDAQGSLMTYIVRCNGTLAGYAVFILGPSFDRVGGLWAKNATLYVKPEYRGKDGVTVPFIQAIEEDLEYEEGVDRIDLQFKPGKVPFTLLDVLGYEPSEVTFSKVLEE